MTAGQGIAQQFLDALATNSAAALEAVLTEDAGLRLMRWDGVEAYRPRERVIEHLQAEWSSWPDARLECLSTLADGERAAVEYRIQATDPISRRYVEHSRSAFLALAEGRVAMIDMYCAEPFPSSHRHGWIAPGTLTDDEIGHVLEEQYFSFDARDQLPPKIEGGLSLRRAEDTSGIAHPGSNSFGGARWTAAEADAQIEAVIEARRRRGIGFNWWVAPHDTPADLCQRLEAHGLARAGSTAVMVRRGLDDLDTIPINPAITVEPVDVTREDQLDAILKIGAASFSWTAEQLPEMRAYLLSQASRAHYHETEFPFMAYLDGQPAGFARMSLQAGLAYLSGAATLPELRGRKIYSTLLRRRLETACEHGYQLAGIQAGPMSRRVVARYGFVEYAQTHIYAWMPVIDMDVIQSLVPHD